jgi:Tol biopolymer transport system component/tRNA A-37 threonylcarbamoyl transferase component Bud32
MMAPVNLDTDSPLLHYRILAKLGEGGMGVVWKALDTKLDREVAIKVLPDAFTADAERLARFEREAKLLASLNHPGIAGIHALEEGPAGRFLTMELVPGENLDARLERGPLPLAESLDVGRQIAAALEAAHASGVIHRDLKPANVKLARQGEVKVLDFGLAKATDPLPDSASFDLSISPTLTSTGTRAGTILGTAAYMSPEQARGRPVDRRTDLWSFGCVLYECLTGVRLFQAETATDSLAAVLTKDPDWSALPSATPPLVRALLARCLTRDPRKRLQDAGDARVELELAIEDPNGETVGLAAAAGTGGTASPEPARTRLLPWAVAAAGALAAVYLAFSSGAKPTATPATTLRLTLPPSQGTVFEDFGASPPALSPDGRIVAYGSPDSSGSMRLFLRPLDCFDAKPLSGADGAQLAFWSPDSRHLAFVVDGKLKRIDVEIGLQQEFDIEASATGRGGSWGPGGKILFAPNSNSPIYLVKADDGTSRPVTTLDPDVPDVSHRWPHWLPDGDHFLYVLWTNDLEALEEHGGIYVVSISGATPARRLLPDASSVSYRPPGYLLLVRDDNLIAIPYDAGTHQLTGEAAVVAKGVRRSPTHGLGAFTSAPNGTLVYSAAETRPMQLTWFDRQGQFAGTVSEPARILDLRLAPGTEAGRGRAAVTIVGANGDAEIWIEDLGRGVRNRLASGSLSYSHAIFSSAGEEVLYLATGPGDQSDLFRRFVDGSGVEAAVLIDDNDNTLFDWSRDGRHVAYSPNEEPGAGLVIAGLMINRSRDIWIHSLSEKTSRVFATGGDSYGSARFSPDGRWIAYDANESGRLEVYIQAFELGEATTPAQPGPGARFQVSTAGGTAPHWRDDGREIVYQDLDQRVMAVAVEEKNSRLRLGTPEPLFSVAGELIAGDATGDHQNFLFAIRDEVASEPLNVVVNWVGGLQSGPPERR